MSAVGIAVLQGGEDVKLILFLPLLLGTMWVGLWVANTTLSHLITDYQQTSFWDFRWILGRFGRSF